MMMIVKMLKVLTKAIRNYFGDNDDDCEIVTKAVSDHCGGDNDDYESIGGVDIGS